MHKYRSKNRDLIALSSLFLLFEVVRECFGFMIHRISSCWIALLEVSGIFETGTKSILSNNWITGELLWMGSYKRGNFTFRANDSKNKEK